MLAERDLFMTKKIKTIYVKLEDEGIDVWKPVNAEVLDKGRFRILGVEGGIPESEIWEFQPDQLVFFRSTTAH